MIELENVSVHYNNTLALQNISLKISGASMIGIIGPNGAGKSTLIKAMLGIIPHQGQVLLDGKALTKSLYKVAYVEQKSNIDYHFPIKVKECVSLGLYPRVKFFRKLKAEDWKKVDEALDLVGLSDYSERQISQLSGGQFQRVLIARCLVQDADYIFLDEPFVGIDSISEDIIMNTLRKLKQEGKTILIVHHDLEKVESYFDQVLLLSKEVIAFGDTNSTFTHQHLKETYGSRLFFQGGSQ